MDTVQDVSGMTEPGGTLLPTWGYSEWLVDTGLWAKTTRRARYPKGVLVVGRRQSRV